MKRDKLFLLAPGFFDNDRREDCPECAEILFAAIWNGCAARHGADLKPEIILR